MKAAAFALLAMLIFAVVVGAYRTLVPVKDSTDISSHVAELTSEDPPEAGVPSGVKNFALKTGSGGERLSATADEIAALEKETRPVFSLRIIGLIPGSQAAALGLKVGDAIVKINGNTIWSFRDFPAHQVDGPNKYQIWSPRTGETEITATGKVGIHHLDDLRMDLAYIRCQERSPAWDGPAIVAARNWMSNPVLASEALGAARAAGFKGAFNNALAVLIAGQRGRHIEALKNFDAIAADLPKGIERFVLRCAYLSAVYSNNMKKAAEIAVANPAYDVQPNNWDSRELQDRLECITDADRALLNPDGTLKKKPLKNYAGQLEALNGNAKYVLDFWKKSPRKSFAGTMKSGDISDMAFGPYLKNVHYRVAFNFAPLSNTIAEDFIRFSLSDPIVSRRKLVELHCSTPAPPTLLCDGYPDRVIESIKTGKDNVVDFFLNGPWLEVWLNGDRLFLASSPKFNREVFMRVEVSGVRAAYGDIVYEELDDANWHFNPRERPPGAKIAAQPLKVPPKPEGELGWFYDAFVSAYLTHGDRSPAWDKDAVEALALEARFLPREKTDSGALCAAAKRAINAGCDDPLVLLALGDGLQSFEDSYSARAVRCFKQAADSIMATKYHPLLKFVILERAINAENRAGWSRNIARSIERRPTLVALIPEILADKSAPQSYVRRNMLNAIDIDRLGQMDRLVATKPALDAIEQSAPNSSLALTVEGAIYIDYAWDARGSGWASTVTSSGWKYFHERLKTAETLLEKAYKLDPTNSQAMELMITVAMGGAEKYDVGTALELAVKADPNNFNAYTRALGAVRPRWGGSSEAMLRFGRECYELLESGKINCVSLATLTRMAHQYTIEDQTIDSADKAGPTQAYYLKPEVWVDIERGCKLLVKLHPSALNKTEYAKQAIQAGKWKLAHEIFEELGPNVAGAPFDGMGQAREKVIHAKIRAGAKK